MSRFMISGFSDEIDENTTLQFEHLNKLGIEYFEPRGIDGKNIADLNDDEVSALKEKMDKYGIKVSSIGSPIGKIQITDDFETHLKKLERVIRTAKMLDTKYIRVFSFFIPNGEYEKHRDEVICRMKAMAVLAEEDSKPLLGKDYWGSSHEVLIKNYYDFNKYFTPYDIKNTMNTMFAMYESARQDGKETEI